MTDLPSPSPTPPPAVHFETDAPSDSDLDQAGLEGCNACMDGYKLSDNPYAKGTLQWFAWREGWNSEFEENAND